MSNNYEIQTRAELAHAAQELLASHPIAAAPVVDLVERTETLEAELASTLLYSVSHHPYRQIRDLVAALPEARITEIIELGLRHRGTALHGYETPACGDLGPEVNILAEAGVLADFQSAIEQAHSASARIAASQVPEAAQSALYLLPLATRIRSLFKMDFAEAQYIIELRSGPAGHFSYRRIAWEMFLALKRQHPALAKHIRVTDFTQPIDLLQR